MNWLDNVYAVLPQGMVLFTGCLVLLLSLFTRRSDSPILYAVALLGLGLAAVISPFAFGVAPLSFLSGEGISDSLSAVMNTSIVLTVLFVLIYARDYMITRQMPMSDILVLMLFSTTGMMVFVCAQTILSAFLGLELLSLPLYALTAVQRADGDASEAALKYFVMGAIASSMLMFGFSLLYGVTGQLHFDAIAKVLSTQSINHHGLLTFALMFILAGMGFKLALVPFHQWVPDVYQGAPLSVTLFLSTAPKLAGVGFLIHLLMLALPDLAAQWQLVFMAMGILSVAMGNLFAIAQNNIRRLLGYSAIAHLGFVALGILTASTTGYISSVYYILVYVVMSLAAFGALVLLSRHGLEIEEIDDLKGLNQRNPWVALMMMIILFSMAGVPPTAGFLIKLTVLKALIDVQLTWIAFLAAVLTVIGAFYYLRIVKVMYFDDPIRKEPLAIGGRLSGLCFSVNCLSLLYFGLFPAGLVAVCSAVFR